MRSDDGSGVNVTPNAPMEISELGPSSRGVEIVGSNAPSTDKRFCEFVFINNGFEIIGVSLRVVILCLERLTTLTMSARVVTDLIKGD